MSSILSVFSFSISITYFLLAYSLVHDNKTGSINKDFIPHLIIVSKISKILLFIFAFVTVIVIINPTSIDFIIRDIIVFFFLPCISAIIFETWMKYKYPDEYFGCLEKAKLL